MEKEQVKEVLKELRNEGKIIFSSHDFIKKFAETYERDYITMLWEKRNTEHPFQTVHLQIGLELERMQNEFGFEKNNSITDDGRDYSENVFGNTNKVQFWKFL